MAYTLGDIADKVRYRIKDSSYSSTEIRNYINDTINDIYNEYRLRFMETSTPFTLTANDPDITSGSGLPTDFVQAINLSLTSSAYESVLQYKEHTEIDALYPDPTDTTIHPANVPQYWYMFGEEINVFPVPNTAYTVKLKYYKRPTMLSSDADVPDIPSEFEEILVIGASYRIFQVKDNYDKAGVLENKYQELLDKLVARYSVSQVGQATQMRINRYAME